MLAELPPFAAGRFADAVDGFEVVHAQPDACAATRPR
jgi:hypothetical protein